MIFPLSKSAILFEVKSKQHSLALALSVLLVHFASLADSQPTTNHCIYDETELVSIWSEPLNIGIPPVNRSAVILVDYESSSTTSTSLAVSYTTEAGDQQSRGLGITARIYNSQTVYDWWACQRIRSTVTEERDTLTTENSCVVWPWSSSSALCHQQISLTGSVNETVRAVFAIVNLGTEPIPPDTVLKVEAAVLDVDRSFLPLNPAQSVCHRPLTSVCEPPVEDFVSLPPLLPLLAHGDFCQVDRVERMAIYEPVTLACPALGESLTVAWEYKVHATERTAFSQLFETSSSVAVSSVSPDTKVRSADGMTVQLRSQALGATTRPLDLLGECKHSARYGFCSLGSVDNWRDCDGSFASPFKLCTKARIDDAQGGSTFRSYATVQNTGGCHGNMTIEVSLEDPHSFYDAGEFSVDRLSQCTSPVEVHYDPTFSASNRKRQTSIPMVASVAISFLLWGSL